MLITYLPAGVVLIGIMLTKFFKIMPILALLFFFKNNKTILLDYKENYNFSNSFTFL